MQDAIVKRLIQAETVRQKRAINLIASENYVSAAVLAALGSVFTNKYAEGYPDARYYGGNAVVDKIETLCQTRALKLFKLRSIDWAVNVQPLSGSPANLAVYLATVPPGGKIMGLKLEHGGHLTHGHKVSASGKLWSPVVYEVDRATEQLDYAVVEARALKERPALIVVGFTAYPRVVDWAAFRRIADRSGALLVVDMSHLAGLVAGGAYPSPFPFADIVTTTTHKTLRGPRGAMIFSRRDARDLPKKIDRAVFPGLQGGPHVNQIAAVAVALGEAVKPAFRKYARQVIKNTEALGAELLARGWRLVTGGTDSHLILVDTWQGGSGPSGRAASEALERRGIIVNKNSLPFDARPPADPSGIRLGMAAETTRGATVTTARQIAQKIDTILKSIRPK